MTSVHRKEEKLKSLAHEESKDDHSMHSSVSTDRLRIKKFRISKTRPSHGSEIGESVGDESTFHNNSLRMVGPLSTETRQAKIRSYWAKKCKRWGGKKFQYECR